MSLLPEMLTRTYEGLTDDQQKAMRILNSQDNVFVTGGAGTGKSYLLKKFLGSLDATQLPVLASTGAAAVLIGGRTFHSFFGLGILEGGAAATVERALKDRRVNRRIKKAMGVVIDEISMIPGHVLQVAEEISRSIRGGPDPWGGLRVIAVGDFAQLPPITKGSYAKKDWAFLSPTWRDSNFSSIELKEIMRSREDPDFCHRLMEARRGEVTSELRQLLDWRKVTEPEENFEGSVLYARKVDVERINLARLAELPGAPIVFESEYSGEERFRRALTQNAPIAEKILLKKGALVMLRQNDPKGKWVNGSLGHIQEIEKRNLVVRFLNGTWADIEPVRFSMQDAEGNDVASVKNFPVNLAYAVTIHKAQGATLDKVMVSLSQLWEPGQAYVALSRVKSASGLWVKDWTEDSIFSDPDVMRFNDAL